METKNLVEFKKGVYLGLEKIAGRVVLRVYNKIGEPFARGHILSTDEKDGRIDLHMSVDEKFGFKLDKEGCVVVENKEQE